MRIVKRIAIALAVLLAMPFVVALFIKRTFVVERAVTINKPQPDVFEYLKHVKNQVNYSRWAMIDPNMQKSYRGTDGTEGFVMAWASDNENVGEGEQEIKKIAEGKRIDVEIRMRKPFQSTDPVSTSAESVADNQTKVTSVYHGKINYPMNLLCPIAEDKIGSEMEAGLTNLKRVLERAQ